MFSVGWFFTGDSTYLSLLAELHAGGGKRPELGSALPSLAAIATPVAKETSGLG